MLQSILERTACRRGLRLLVRHARDLDAALVKFEKRCDIPPAHVLVNATLTGSAPTTTRIHGYDVDEKFVRSAEHGIVQAVADTSARIRTDCQFGLHLAEEKSVGENSRLHLVDVMSLYVGPRDDAVGPPGPFDRQLPVLAFRGPDVHLLGVIYTVRRTPSVA